MHTCTLRIGLTSHQRGRIANMSSFASRVAAKAFEIDVSAVRGLSAVRRGLVVVVILVVGNASVGLDLAVNAATAAFLIGLLDKGRSPRATWEVMGVATILLCVVTAISGAISYSQWAIMAMLAILAFLAGISIAVDQRAPQLFIFSGVLTASHLVNPIDIKDIPVSVLLVAIAGGLQTLCALLVAPFVGDSPERRELASAMRAIAVNCGQLNDKEVGAAREGANAAAVALNSAEGMIKRGDIATEDRGRYAVLLADLDSIRIEARAFSTRIYLGVPIPRSAITLAAFAHAHTVLNHAADVLETRGSVSELEATGDMLLAEQPDDETKAAAAIRTSLAAVCFHVCDILNRRRVHRQLVANSKSFWGRVADAFSPDSPPLLYGYRMAAAAILAGAIAIFFQIPHGSWVAVTAMMLLRPDGTPTAPRILMRAIGTVAAVAAILVILPLTGDSSTTKIFVITIVVCLNYMFAAVNYGAQTAFMAMTVLLLLSLTYPDPEQLALARLMDVILGCLLGTIFAFAMPIWKRSQLRSDVANYAESAAQWFGLLGQAAALPPQGREEMLRTVRRQGSVTRDRRTKAMATLNTTLLEPPHEQINVGSIGIVLSWVRRSTDAGVAAETVLRHGIDGTAELTELSDQTEADLRRTAQVLRAGGGDTIPDEEMRESALARNVIDYGGQTRAMALLARAEISAGAAVRASYRTGAPR